MIKLYINLINFFLYNNLYMNYYQKYLKYKTKYLKLKQIGGLKLEDFIIHNNIPVEVIEIHGKKEIVVKYNNAAGGEVREVVPMLVAEQGERLMNESIRKTAPVGSIFALKADPTKKVYIKQNEFNMRITFEKIDKIENEGKPNEKLVFIEGASGWNTHMESFLLQYTRIK